MQQLVFSLIQICLFKRKPQDLPSSSSLVLNSIAAAFVIFWFRNTLLTSGGTALAVAVVQIALLGAGLKLLLGKYSKSERWHQSATALYGCSALLVALVIPFLLSAGGEQFASESMTLNKLFIIFTSIWYFAIIIFIFRETLEVSLFMAFVLALVLEVILAAVVLQILGSSAA